MAARRWAPLIGGLLLGHFWWGSVFLPSVPIAALVVVLAALWVPRHAGETTEPVDHLGGTLSVVSIGPLVLAISLVPNYGFNGTVLGLFVVALVGLVLFVVRERRAESPLFDLKVLHTRTFTIALIGGTITWVACSAPPSSASSTHRTCWATPRCRRRSSPCPRLSSWPRRHGPRAA